MGRYITESGMKFGEFKDENLFYIEESNVYKSIGTSVKTVEFIAIKDDDIILLEAKMGCPQPCKDEQEDKRLNFEQFYNDIAEKFIDSFHVYLSSILNKHDSMEIGENLKNLDLVKSKNFKFVLVLTSDEIQEDWLRDPKLELDMRLKKYRQIWNVKIIVLNKILAIEKGIAII